MYHIRSFTEWRFHMLNRLSNWWRRYCLPLYYSIVVYKYQLYLYGLHDDKSGPTRWLRYRVAEERNLAFMLSSADMQWERYCKPEEDEED